MDRYAIGESLNENLRQLEPYSFLTTRTSAMVNDSNELTIYGCSNKVEVVLGVGRMPLGHVLFVSSGNQFEGLDLQYEESPIREPFNTAYVHEWNHTIDLHRTGVAEPVAQIDGYTRDLLAWTLVRVANARKAFSG